MTPSLELRRHLKLEGTKNVRDIGGFETVDGRTTRWKTLLRSDCLSALSPKSQEFLINYGLRTAIDLRVDSEVSNSPNVFENSSKVKYHHHDMIGSDDLRETGENLQGPREEIQLAMERQAEAEGRESIALSYCLWIDYRRDKMRDILALLATPGVLPALYHCAAGKDRTGILTALVLGLAGVPFEKIVEDYTRTAFYILLHNPDEEASLESVPSESAWRERAEETCAPSIMVTMLDHIKERYGGIESYVLNIGVTPGQIESIREAFVE